MSTEDNPGYVLRVSTEEWLKQVFERGKYYSGVMRKWKRGTPILLAKKAGASDCFVGYGVVDKVEMLWEMSPEDEAYCREHGWRCAISLNPLVRFEKPYPIGESILRDDRRKGSFFHGARLTEDQVDAILEAAEDNQT